MDDFNDVADFLVIYIAEAHPTDGWTADDTKVSLKNHTSVDERREASELMFSLLERVPCDMVLDDIDDCTSVAYRALPERLYILQKRNVVYQGGPGPFHYIPSEIREWLDTYRRGEKQQ